MVKFLKKKEVVTFIVLMVVATSRAYAQIDLSGAVSSVTNIASQVAGVLGGIVGLYGIGRSAYQFASGGDGISSLITGIVGYVLANIASSLL
jgi:hypothetical protein